MKKYMSYAIITIICSFVFLAIWHFAPKSYDCGYAYNQYSLQAKAWLEGRLDLNRDYSWLELAKFNGKIFVSFPPAPSIILLWFVAVFGITTIVPNLLVVIAGIVATCYAYALSKQFNIPKMLGIILSLLLSIGSNYLCIGVSGGVWHMAQAFGFCFSFMAIYYALTSNKKHTLYSLLLWGFSVGCRPFQIIWLPLLLIYILRKYKNNSMKEKIKSIFIASIPMLILAGFMAWLNYARFGNILEFGHNHLPYYDDKEQFAFHYLKNNLIILFSSLKLSAFSDTAFWITNTIYIVFLIFAIFNIKKIKETLLILILALISICLFALHNTVGEWGWGSRYVIDTTPFIFLATLLLYNEKYRKSLTIISSLLLLAGFALNVYGTLLMYHA